MKIKYRLFSAFLACLLLSTSQAQSLDKAKLDQFFDQLDQKKKAMGNLVISSNGNVVYSRIIGYSQVNDNEKKPLTASTRYRIGSVTKMFTATIIYQLVEEGKLKLDDKLAKFFPQIPNADKITILHILGHKSGMGDLADGSGKGNPITQAELLAKFAKSTPGFEPGEKYAYSNAGYVVLGFIVEKVSGKPYAEVLQQKITSKIGLKDTYLGTGFTDASKNESFSYRFAGDWQKEPETHLSNPGSAGAILSTPADLITFIRALFDLKLFSKKSLDLMIEHRSGMEASTYNDKTFYGHDGGIDNFGAVLLYRPEEKQAFAYATNAKVYPVREIISGIFDIYANKPFTIPSFESLAIGTELLDKYVGVYTLTEAPKFTVTRKDNTLLVQMGDRPPYALEAIGEHKFKIPNAPMEITFDVANKTMTLNRGGGPGGKVFTKEN